MGEAGSWQTVHTMSLSTFPLEWFVLLAREMNMCCVVVVHYVLSGLTILSCSQTKAQRFESPMKIARGVDVW